MLIIKVMFNQATAALKKGISMKLCDFLLLGFFGSRGLRKLIRLHRLTKRAKFEVKLEI